MPFKPNIYNMLTALADSCLSDTTGTSDVHYI